MQKEAKRQTWLTRVQEQAESGLPIRAWCAREGIEESTFHYWRKRLAAPSQPVTKLIAVPNVGRRMEPALEIQTPHGYVIRIGGQAQVSWLGSVLEALR